MRSIRSLRAVAVAVATVFLFGAAGSAAAQQNKIGLIDTQQILRTSTVGKQAAEQLRQLTETKSQEGQAKQTELQALQQRLQEGRRSLSEDKLAELQKQVEDKAIELRRFQDDANRELEKRQEELFGNIDRQVMPVINQIAQEQGYDLIFRKFESGLLYASDTIDITAEVIRRLDAAGN
ncbi:MAG TPA: OmpH family outer membrane protein [Thermoanaerobaculia bacterium]|nr:OmpH family outer membrane protein [Thermoanaerobaculia bacterium]